jgi:acetyl/propionyl-CoA carboxylase alpha subunit
MVAKIVAHGRDRAEAVRKLARALERTALLGTPTNQSFLIDCLRHPTFRSGGAHTGFIDENLPRPSAPPMPPELLAAVLAGVCTDPARAAMLNEPPTILSLVAGDRTIEARVRRVGPAVEATLPGEGGPRTIVVEHLRVDDEEGPLRAIACEIEGRSFVVRLADTGEALLATAGGRSWTLTRPNPLGRRARMSDGTIIAPLSGRVLSVAAELGATVRAGDVLIVIEAMKMEHRLCAGADGLVAAIDVKVGDQTRVGQPLARVAVASNGAKAETARD